MEKKKYEHKWSDDKEKVYIYNGKKVSFEEALHYVNKMLKNSEVTIHKFINGTEEITSGTRDDIDLSQFNV